MSLSWLRKLLLILTDCFLESELDSITKQLYKVLEKYQSKAGKQKAAMNFHIATDMVINAHLYGPLAHNSAFIGENLNFTLSKTYVASNSARFSILFYDMSQLYDIYGMGELKSSECICGNYVLKNG